MNDGPVLSLLGFPSLGRHRRFVAAIAVDAMGSGVFLPMSLLYFIAVTPLTLLEVGLAVSVGSAASLPAGLMIGGAVDRWGARSVLLTGNALQALGFMAYLWTQSMVAVTLWTMVIAVGRSAFWGSYGAIVAAISSPGERERWFGFLGALRNVGFAVGGLASGVAISLDSRAVFAGVVAVNATSYAVAFALLLGVPDTRGVPADTMPGTWREVLADRPYRWLVLTQLGHSLAIMVLNFALPVYVVEVLELPGWVSGAVFTLNTVMVGFGQGLVVLGLTGRVRWRILILVELVFAASWLVFWGASMFSAWWAIGVILLGAVVYTAAEMIGGPVLGALAVEAAPAHLRGRYLALTQLAWGIAGVIAPLAFAWLLSGRTQDLWVGLLGLSGLTIAITRRLGGQLPNAAQPVTNVAQVA